MLNHSSSDDKSESSSNTSDDFTEVEIVHELDSDMILATNSTELVGELIGQIMNTAEEASVLGNFVFIGEIIDVEGIPRLILVTSDNLPEWIARGMISTAEDMLYDGIPD